MFMFLPLFVYFCTNVQKYIQFDFDLTPPHMSSLLRRKCMEKIRISKEKVRKGKEKISKGKNGHQRSSKVIKGKGN